MKETVKETIVYISNDGAEYENKYHCLISDMRGIFDTDTSSGYIDKDFISAFAYGILWDKGFKRKVMQALKELE